jgi:nucleotide-binding universal stress UspA family protein
MRKIVVGTDGSENASIAMRWAVDEAKVHRAAVDVVLAWTFLDQHHPDRSDTFDPQYTEEQARATLSSWVDETLGADASVTQRTVCDVPVRALLECSDAADLLVLGARGRDGFDALLLGSVSEQVAQIAASPVAIVRTAAPVRGGRVVVGVDGSARSVEALRWAAAEARARDADLDVLHAWPSRTPAASLAPIAANLANLEEGGSAALEAAVADPALRDVRVHAHLKRDRPARALIAQAADAALLVVGTRGRGRMTAAVLGSVSRQLLQHSPCPVVII